MAGSSAIEEGGQARRLALYPVGPRARPHHACLAAPLPQPGPSAARDPSRPHDQRLSTERCQSNRQAGCPPRRFLKIGIVPRMSTPAAKVAGQRTAASNISKNLAHPNNGSNGDSVPATVPDPQPHASTAIADLGSGCGWFKAGRDDRGQVTEYRSWVLDVNIMGVRGCGCSSRKSTYLAKSAKSLAQPGRRRFHPGATRDALETVPRCGEAVGRVQSARTPVRGSRRA